VAVEKDLDKLGRLQQGMIPIHEEGLKDFFIEVVKCGRLTFTHDLEEALAYASVVFIAVGTPAMVDGRVDLSQVNHVSQTVARPERPLIVINLKMDMEVKNNRNP